jgi:two-component system alkaline phosphatase synthesis response regulator PhoP
MSTVFHRVRKGRGLALAHCPLFAPFASISILRSAGEMLSSVSEVPSGNVTTPLTPFFRIRPRTTVDKVLRLKIGANDYLTKPFEVSELMARIEVLLRRPAIRDSSFELQLGSIRFNTRRAELSRSGKPIPISAREFRLLRYFIEHRGEALTREELLQAVWGYDSAPTTRTVDVHVVWLRQKLEDDPKKPKWILTVHGIGYRFAG